MLTVDEFTEKILHDFKKVFPEVKVGENLIHLGSGVTYVELPLGSMYREYQMTDYCNTKELYVKIASEIFVNAGINLTHQSQKKIDPPLCLVSNRFRF